MSTMAFAIDSASYRSVPGLKGYTWWINIPPIVINIIPDIEPTTTGKTYFVNPIGL